ncbi:phage tail sheath subtilisin-like domain-containing protein [Sorangium sp. So ce281]|uniref:phage tail sheath family protein n=1 Tax=unclassified Sorangium TaxID=2621164 RepID=UPI003F642758
MANYSSPGVYVEQVPSGSAPIAGVGTSTAGFVGAFAQTLTVPNPIYDSSITDTNDPRHSQTITETIPTAPGEVKLITNFSEFKAAFKGFLDESSHRPLAHAVNGFFLNGGTRCYVAYVVPPASPALPDITGVLERFESIDEIAIVASPGLAISAARTALKDHCEKMGTRVAILETEEFGNVADALSALDPDAAGSTLPSFSDSTALYFPWIEVFDPASKTNKFVPPSGHIAGIYARVDAQRGVHKAPANEPIRGALGVRHALSKSQQEGLNPQGVNAIRSVNGAIKVWGARTLGGDENGEFKYLNVRRLFNFVRGSIDQGMQWAVFEPNNPDLWAKITRNTAAFLTTVWAAGGLFGDKPEQAFYVKCDAETNPPAQRDLGQVVTEIGIAIVRPAEFVIFRLGQTAGS